MVIDSRRRRLLAGKIAGLAAVLVVVVTFAAVVGAIVAFAISGSQGVDTDAWATGNGAIQGASIIANLAPATTVWGLFGALIAIVSRSAAISIAAGVAYFLIGERLILHSLWPLTADWLPAGILDALAEGGTESRAFATALAFAAGYAAVAYLAGTVVFERRDVTD